MKKIKLLFVLVLLMFSCESNDELCNSRCSEVIETKDVQYGAVIITLRNQCTGELTQLREAQVDTPLIGTVICK